MKKRQFTIRIYHPDTPSPLGWGSSAEIFTNCTIAERDLTRLAFVTKTGKTVMTTLPYKATEE